LLVDASHHLSQAWLSPKNFLTGITTLNIYCRLPPKKPQEGQSMRLAGHE
jgi:hypothetical protein